MNDECNMMTYHQSTAPFASPATLMTSTAVQVVFSWPTTPASHGRQLYHVQSLRHGIAAEQHASELASDPSKIGIFHIMGDTAQAASAPSSGGSVGEPHSAPRQETITEQPGSHHRMGRRSPSWDIHQQSLMPIQDTQTVPETRAPELHLRGGEMCPGRFCFIIPCPLPCNCCVFPCPC